MTTISIIPENTSVGEILWRAIAGDKESVGKSAGEALDALISQFSEDEGSAMIVIRRWQPDRSSQELIDEVNETWEEFKDAFEEMKRRGD